MERPRLIERAINPGKTFNSSYSGPMGVPRLTDAGPLSDTKTSGEEKAPTDGIGDVLDARPLMDLLDL